MHPPLAQKRKPQHSLSYDDPYNVELFRMTVSKILSQPVRRVGKGLLFALPWLFKSTKHSLCCQAPQFVRLPFLTVYCLSNLH